jgi:cysteine peptidase B
MYQAFVLLVLILTAVHAAEYNYDLENAAPMWEEYKITYGKSYASVSEERSRFENFKTHLQTAAIRNAENPHATFGINKFFDLSVEEFKAQSTGLKRAKSNTKKDVVVVAPLYTQAAALAIVAATNNSFDWRAKGAVTSVKNQGQCGSCWAFTATGNIEGQWFIKTGTLVTVSAQELVSCDTQDDGCNGGLMDTAFDWLVSSMKGAITYDIDYPYVSTTGDVPKCNNSKVAGAAATITGRQEIAKDEVQMAAWLTQHGPISAGVDATTFCEYKSGIITNCISQNVDHSILVVGYGVANGINYWILKNSWSSTWGESGYVRIEKGSNQCLVTSEASSANV